MKEIRHILVIKPSSFGDILHAFPALALLRRCCPQAELDYLVNPEFAPLLAYSPFPVRKILFFERHKLDQFRLFLPEFFRLCRTLRRTRYDLVLDFQGLLRSALCARLCRARRIIGFADPREKLARFGYTEQYSVAPGHAVERCLSLAAQAVKSPVPPELPDLPADENAARSAVEKIGAISDGYLVLLPGTRWESKRFPPALFAEIVQKIREKHPRLVFVAAGSREERSLGEAIGNGVRVLAGKTTLPELMELLRGAKAVIGNDSGPLHAAAALKRPIFGFYGPTDPRRTGPYGNGVRIFSAAVPCSPCLLRQCPKKYECHRLPAEEIAAAVENVL